MIQREMQAPFGVHISHRKAYSTCKKALKKVVSDFDKDYGDVLDFYMS